MNKAAWNKAQKRTENLTNETNSLNEFIKEIDKLYEQCEYDNVLSKCNEAESRFPNHKITFWYTKALCLDNLEKNDEANACIQAILNVDPKHSGARAWLATDEFDKIFNNKVNKLNPGLIKKIEDYASKLGSNTELVNSINKMSESIGPYLNCSHSALTYQKKLQEEIEKKEKDKNYTPDFASLKGSLNDILNNKEKLDELKQLEKKAKDLRTSLPEDYTKFAKLFSFLSHLDEVESKYVPELAKICSMIGVKYEYLKFYLTMFNILKESEEEDEKETKDSKKEEVQLWNDYPPYKESPFDRSSKPLGQVLHELAYDTIEKTKLSPQRIEEYLSIEEKSIFNSLTIYKQTFSSNSTILSLINDYEKVKTYSQQWLNKNPVEIRNWADRCKGNLNNVHEAIAVMDRANSVIMGGHYLRHSQIISLLAFFDTTTQEQGKLLQISTGEGKTLIVSFFAAICALKGETVDVITSNTVLAESGVKERSKFYNLLGLTVTHNNSEKKTHCFPKVLTRLTYCMAVLAIFNLIT